MKICLAEWKGSFSYVFCCKFIFFELFVADKFYYVCVKALSRRKLPLQNFNFINQVTVSDFVGRFINIEMWKI